MKSQLLKIILLSCIFAGYSFPIKAQFTNKPEEKTQSSEPIFGIDIFKDSIKYKFSINDSSTIEHLSLTFDVNADEKIPDFIKKFHNLQTIRLHNLKHNEAIFLDTSHFIWQFPKLRWVYSDANGRKGNEYQYTFSINKYIHIRPEQGNTSFLCDYLNKVQELHNRHDFVIGTYDNWGPSDSCLCALKNVKTLSIDVGSYDAQGSIRPLPSCIENMTSLRKLHIDGNIEDNYPKLNFDFTNMPFLDTLFIPYGLKFKIKDTHWDSIKLLQLGVGFGYTARFARRLRHKYPKAEIELFYVPYMKLKYKTRQRTYIYPSEYGSDFETLKHVDEIMAKRQEKKDTKDYFLPKQMTFEFGYLPTNVFRFNIGMENYFLRQIDKHGGNYTGGTHVVNFNMGIFFVAKKNDIFNMQLRYDYNLPHIPLFFGLGFEAYKPLRAGRIVPYARPRIGSTPFPNFGFWASYGLPLSQRRIDYLPAFEIGVNFRLTRDFFTVLKGIVTHGY